MLPSENDGGEVKVGNKRVTEERGMVGGVFIIKYNKISNVFGGALPKYTDSCKIVMSYFGACIIL